jgi:hypothetical protein
MRKDILEKKDDILIWIEEHRPKSYMYRLLECKPSTLDHYLKIMNINYKGNMGLKGIKINPFRKDSMYYIENDYFIKSLKLKNKLIEDGLKENKCEICNNSSWNKQIIPLELHHIDGDNSNNKIENLQIICPNCHAQTDNYRNRNKPKESAQKEKTEKIKIQKYCECGKEISEKAKNCKSCSKKMQDRKVKDRPTKEDLLSMIKESSLEAIGRKYNVSGNAVKKWIK